MGRSRASPEALADRWVREMDANGVHRAALIASVPGDESSVAAAVARHPGRLVGFFMVDPAAGDAPARPGTGADRTGAHRGLSVPGDAPRAAGRRRARCGSSRRPLHARARWCSCTADCCRWASATSSGLPSRSISRSAIRLAVSRLAPAFPEMPFIVPHFGAGRFADLLEAVDACANVHLDTSSSNNWIRAVPGLALSDVFRSALAAAGASRLLFGTDSSFFPRGWQRRHLRATEVDPAGTRHHPRGPGADPARQFRATLPGAPVRLKPDTTDPTRVSVIAPTGVRKIAPTPVR